MNGSLIIQDLKILFIIKVQNLSLIPFNMFWLLTKFKMFQLQFQNLSQMLLMNIPIKHQTIDNALCAILHAHQPANQAEAVTIIDNCFATARFAVRSAVHRTLNVSPGAMVFQRDMILPIPLIADFELIRQRRQAVVDDNKRRQNLRRIFHDYNVGDEVLIINQDSVRVRTLHCVTRDASE